MRRLSAIDTAFLLAERRHQPLHVGALSLFRPPADAPKDFVAQLAARLRASTSASPPFNRRLESHWGVKSWVEARDFDIGQHFVHLSLPKPGRIRELLAMVSRVHSAHLDRAYPLWRMYLIEGLGDGRIATYTKIHHSLVDGVAGIRLMLKSMSEDPVESMQMPAPWEVKPARRSGIAPSMALGTLAAATQLARSGYHAAPAVFSQIKRTVQDLRNHHPHAVSSFQAPRCVLNSPITGSRRFAAQSYSTTRVRAIACATGCTLNDVALALCGAALRRYLLELGELPDQPLIAGVPVSIRRGDSDSGNEIAFALANLGTDRADPLARLQQVKGSMDYAKDMLHQMSPAQIMAYTVAMLTPGAFTLIPGVTRTRTVINVVISHVRGPREQVYWQGCRLEGIYPASLVLDGFALNITLISRGDAIDFGILACRRTLPRIQNLLQYLDDAIVELEAALGLSPAIADEAAGPALVA